MHYRAIAFALLALMGCGSSSLTSTQPQVAVGPTYASGPPGAGYPAAPGVPSDQVLTGVGWSPQPYLPHTSLQGLPFPPAPQAPATLQPTYTIQVRNAVVSPGKAGGNKPWDGTNAVPMEVMAKLALGLGGASAHAGALAALGMLANGTYDPPDVAGDVSLLISGAPVQSRQLSMSSDSYVPSWPEPATFSQVPLDDRLSLQVHLVDRDLAFDDEVGVVIIKMADIRDGLAKGGEIHQVPVHRQQAQILFVGIAVFRE